MNLLPIELLIMLIAAVVLPDPMIASQTLTLILPPPEVIWHQGGARIEKICPDCNGLMPHSIKRRVYFVRVKKTNEFWISEDAEAKDFGSASYGVSRDIRCYFLSLVDHYPFYLATLNSPAE